MDNILTINSSSSIIFRTKNEENAWCKDYRYQVLLKGNYDMTSKPLDLKVIEPMQEFLLLEDVFPTENNWIALVQYAMDLQPRNGGKGTHRATAWSSNSLYRRLPSRNVFQIQLMFAGNLPSCSTILYVVGTGVKCIPQKFYFGLQYWVTLV